MLVTSSGILKKKLKLTSKRLYACKLMMYRQKTLEMRLCNMLMRRGLRLKVLFVIRKWWVKEYREFYRVYSKYVKKYEPEEVAGIDPNRTEFVKILRRKNIPWSLSYFLKHRLESINSMFQIQIKSPKINTWTVRYLTYPQRAPYAMKLWVLHLRAIIFLNIKWQEKIGDQLADFIEKEEELQPVYELKLEAYKQLLV